MPCRDAMIKKVISADADMTVEEVLKIFQEHHIRGVPVVNDQKHVVGLFNFRHLLHEILPVAATLDEVQLRRLKNMSISLGHIAGVSPWVARRLGVVLPKKVSDVMAKEFKWVNEDTPLREGIRMLYENGSPIPVVAEDDKTLVGLITSQSVIEQIVHIRDDMAEGKPVDE